MFYLITKPNGKAGMIVRTLKEAKQIAEEQANKLNHSYKHNGVEIFADDDPDMRQSSPLSKHFLQHLAASQGPS